MPFQPIRNTNPFSYMHSWHEGPKDIPAGVSEFFREKPWCLSKKFSAARVCSVVPLLLCPPCWLLNLPLFLPNCHNHSSLPCFPRLLTCCFTASVPSSDRWSLPLGMVSHSFLHASPGSCSLKLRDVVLFSLICNCLKHTVIALLFPCFGLCLVLAQQFISLN